MDTELSFLVEIVLYDKPNKVIKEKLLERIKLVQSGPQRVTLPYTAPPPQLAQSPSTLAAMQRHANEGTVDVPPAQPIATTPQASQALALRQKIIDEAINGKAPGRTSPRKF